MRQHLNKCKFHRQTDLQTLSFVWLCMTVYDYVWLCMTMYDYVWLCMTIYVFVWLCLTVYGNVWLCMTMKANKLSWEYHTRICLPLFTFDYPGLPLLTYVYLCLPLFILVQMAHLCTNFALVFRSTSSYRNSTSLPLSVSPWSKSLRVAITCFLLLLLAT